MGNKKIIILTVYNSENCGSFLQAYALKRTLENLGAEVAFFKRSVKGTSHRFKPHFFQSLRALLRLNFKEAYFVMGQWFSFTYAVSKLKICDKKSEFYREASMVVIGSDTLWCFDAPYFKKNYSIYGGNIFKDKKCITYAVSAGNTSESLFSDTTQGRHNIEKFLVRDTHTGKLVKNIFHESSNIVCDPTFLLRKDEYSPLDKGRPIKEKYILIYYFGKLNDDEVTHIKEYANLKNLKIVSIISRRPWCYKSVVASPSNMISCFNHADYVVTNTFHGCALSLIFEKPYVVYDEGKNKIKEILNSFNESYRLVNKSESISDILDINNNVVQSGQISKIKDLSTKLLKDNINSESYGNN